MSGDPFSQLLGARRGGGAGDPGAAVQEGEYYESFARASAESLHPRTVAEILKALSPFADELALHFLAPENFSFKKRATLEGSQRAVAVSEGVIPWCDNEPRFYIHIAPTGTPAFATVGALRKLLVEQRPSDKTWFRPPSPSSAETLCGYQLFRAPGGSQRLALLTVY